MKVRVPWQKWITFFHTKEQFWVGSSPVPGTNLKGGVVSLLVRPMICGC